MAQTKRLATLKVLHVTRWPYLAACGVQAYLASLAESLRESSVSMSQVAVMPGVVPEGLTPPLSRGGTGPQWINVLRLLAWLWRNVGHFDVVHVHNAVSWQLVVAALTCRLRRVPYVVSSHGSLYEWSLWRRGIKATIFMRSFGRPLLRRAAALIATTPAEAAVIRAVDPGFRVAVASPGIPMPPDAQPGATGTDTVLRVVFLGRLEMQKGLPVLLSALEILDAQRKAATLDIIGTGRVEFVEELRALATRLGVDKATRFHGAVSGDEKWARLRQGHVMALPSKMENFSFATAEALAAGLPVVISDEVALAEIVRKNGCGTVVPGGNAAALAEALWQYHDLNLRSHQGRRARACAEHEFSLEAMGAAHETLYHEVASLSGRPPATNEHASAS